MTQKFLLEKDIRVGDRVPLIAEISLTTEAPVLISELCGKSSELLSKVSSLEHWALHLKAVANPMRPVKRTTMGACDREVLGTKRNQALRMKAPTFVRLQPLAAAAKYGRVAHRTALR
jgi:hypothetical protein